MYEFREVTCPFCHHTFMWNKTGGDFGVYIYRMKETGEHIKAAKCPKCGKEMLVLPHASEGIDCNDNRIEAIGIRGI